MVECITGINESCRKTRKQHIIEKGSYHQGVPAITVVVDGGWSKCTHKHSYNGVGVIFGKHTGKLLYIGVSTSASKIGVVLRHQWNQISF